MNVFRLLLLVVSAVAVSCERHEFDGPDGTRQLHEKHGAPAAGHDEEKQGH